MSLKSLCDVETVTIKRVDVTINAAMGQSRTYTAAKRTTDGLATSSRGRLQQLTENRRFKFGGHDTEVDAVWYTITDPQVDSRDQLVTSDGEVYFVHGLINFDRLNRLYRIGLNRYTKGPR